MSIAGEPDDTSEIDKGTDRITGLTVDQVLALFPGSKEDAELRPGCRTLVAAQELKERRAKAKQKTQTTP
jgi:hypothetical protein